MDNLLLVEGQVADGAPDGQRAEQAADTERERVHRWPAERGAEHAPKVFGTEERVVPDLHPTLIGCCWCWRLSDLLVFLLWSKRERVCLGEGEWS